MSRTRSGRRRSLSALLIRCVEAFETRQLLSAATSPIDGIGNNEQNPEWGSTHIELLRIAEAEYADGHSSPSGTNRPSAREVSNAIISQESSLANARGLSDFVWMWGQFIDHDLDLSSGADPAELFAIQVPAGDSHFDPFGTGTATISLNRSDYVDGDSSSNGQRQQLNVLTAFLDGSVVYGSDQERAAALRTFSGGRLKTSDGDLLPYNTDGLDNAGGTSSSLFLAGDVRANENVALTSMHTLFVREHNRIADELAAAGPALTDQELYDRARSIVAAEIQAITYNEFLPALLGTGALADYAGYDNSVNVGITNEFSTAAYRFGHSLLSPTLLRLDTDGNVIGEGNLALRDAFFRPDQVIALGIDSLLQGAATQTAQELDAHVIDDVRNFLFGPPGAGGLDLPALNIQRGRDHGLADYNATRVALGLSPVSSFSQISSDSNVVAALELTYGSVDEIDLWVGGLAEDQLPDASMGETFTQILVDQFERLRDGDRFWYQNVFTGTMLAQIQSTRLADIIKRNSNVANLQTNVFFVAGTEPVSVDLQKQNVRSVVVRSNQGGVEVADAVSGRVLVRRAEGELGSLTVRGSSGNAERVVVSAGIPGSAVPMGIRFLSGSGENDTLEIRGSSTADRIEADGRSVRANTLDIVFENVQELLLSGEDGNDELIVRSSDASTITLDGGKGDDRLEGSHRDERMFGGEGNDLLLGGDGDDQLFGGPGNDRLYGGNGRDQLIGSGGNDLLVPEGRESDRTSLSEQALFLDTQFQIRFSGNFFTNWGGRNEKWLLSNSGWLLITPNGSLYRWDGLSKNATGLLVARLHPDAYSNPALLYNTSQNFRDNDPADSLTRLAKSLDQNLQLRKSTSYHDNWGGRGEKWIPGRTGWYFITRDGRLYEWDGSRNAGGRLIAELDATYYNNPRMLHDMA